MKLEAPSVQQAVSALLACATLTASVLVPLMDRSQRSATPALETEHHASTCVVGHDHTICTQVGANLWIAPAEGATLARRPALHLPATAVAVPLGSRRPHASPWTRAPPAA